jgi:hypothetical protein
MDEWIISSIKYENDALNNLTKLFDNFIEKGRTIKIDNELDIFDIYRKIDTDNYLLNTVIILSIY